MAHPAPLTRARRPSRYSAGTGRFVLLSGSARDVWSKWLWRLHHRERLVLWTTLLLAFLAVVEQGGQACLQLGAAKGAIVAGAARDRDRPARHQELVALGRLGV